MILLSDSGTRFLVLFVILLAFESEVFNSICEFKSSNPSSLNKIKPIRDKDTIKQRTPIISNIRYLSIECIIFNIIFFYLTLGECDSPLAIGSSK